VDRAPFLGWRDVLLAEAVEAQLAVPVIVENDVVAPASAEHWFGLGRGFSNFAVLTVGAGVGYGLVMHDQVVSTAQAGLGLGGHFPLDASGPLCFLGRRGCSTAMLTIPSIRAQVNVALGVSVSYADVLDLARNGNPVALAVLRAAGTSLGRLIAAVANLAMVQRVVLAGEGLGFLQIVRAEMEAAILADRDPAAADVAVLLDASGFISWAQGTAAVAIQHTMDTLPVGG
jgi:predicted NBD/HSP70 family sugar kinase